MTFSSAQLMRSVQYRIIYSVVYGWKCYNCLLTLAINLNCASSISRSTFLLLLSSYEGATNNFELNSVAVSLLNLTYSKFL